MKENVKEVKRMNRIRIANFIAKKGVTSKAEIATELGLSMPTTLQNVKELVEDGLVVENGEYESTGGRKAKALTIVEDAGYVIGMDITANHITFVLVDLRYQMKNSQRIRIAFKDDFLYYEEMGRLLHEFINSSKKKKKKILGVGISLPGIVDQKEKVLLRSHALGVENISFRKFESLIQYPFELENDANSAAYAELMNNAGNAVYLSLSNTVGGAIYIHDQLYPGENFRSGEFGHMVIEKDGKACYCGKKGCVDAYCSAKTLASLADDNLEKYFEKLKAGDKKCKDVWEEYLDYLAITVTNLRMAFDCDVVLGGYVGGYMKDYLPGLNRKVMKYNNFDLDTLYLRTGKYRLEASAYGSTLKIVDQYYEQL